MHDFSNSTKATEKAVVLSLHCRFISHFRQAMQDVEVGVFSTYYDKIKKN
ncbi:hypothetical protein BBR47_08190 [Brevibacillus brevis NBRC 100599]|uniref:Uncharacterized protein n=1 Tax=Brevibacillus brevis (strain 47 / JCM 6285 / NBRC 100599) TaxID=358681 RepID=C0Z4R9_BREBN|nr:hypothetical protein BBR47_08190 [Brevibacillus brevis NBRC 100599]